MTFARTAPVGRVTACVTKSRRGTEKSISHCEDSRNLRGRTGHPAPNRCSHGRRLPYYIISHSRGIVKSNRDILLIYHGQGTRWLAPRRVASSAIPRSVRRPSRYRRTAVARNWWQSHTQQVRPHRIRNRRAGVLLGCSVLSSYIQYSTLSHR
jgi:hypothetical protein